MESDTLEQKYQKLFQDGKLVHIRVTKWNMSAPLQAEDLQLKKDQIPEIAKLGTKMLFEYKVLSKFLAVEGKARRYLVENSFKFPIAETHFVPKRKLIAVCTKLKEFETEYRTLVADFINNYETYKKEVIAKHPELEESLLPYYPEAKSLAEKFSFETTVFEVSFPSKLKQLEYEEILDKASAALEIKAEMKLAYEQELEAQRAEATKRMTSFVSESAKALRGQVLEVFNKIASKIQNKELITTTNTKTIKSILADFRDLDFFNDKVVNTRLSEIEELVNTTSNFKDNKEATERLGLALGNVINAVNNMTDVDSLTGEYFRKLSL